MPHVMLLPAFALVLLTCPAGLEAQQTTPVPTHVGTNTGWSRVEALPVNSKLHVSTDHGGTACRIVAVTDEALTCAKGGSSAGTVIQRAEIQHIKLTHRLRSTLVGAGVGAGIGAASGGIAGRSKPCPTGQNLCFNNIGIGAGGVAAIFGVAGALVGGILGGTTDMARGGPIYTRP